MIKNILRNFLLITLFFLSSNSLALDFPLLRLNKNGHSIFLIGSMHVGLASTSRTKDINALLKNNSSVCMENDADDRQSAIHVAQTIFANPPGLRLKDRIGPVLYDESKEQLKWYISTGASIDDISPYVLFSLLTMNMPNLRDFMFQLTPQNSLDAVIRTAAASMKQPLLSIEDKNAVPSAFSSLTDEEWKYFVSGILHILHCKECIKSYSENMIHTYDVGTDFDAAHWSAKQAFASDAKLFAIFEKLYYGDRNITMAKNIENDALNNKKCDIVAIGLGHLGGPLGVVARLQNNGVQIEIFNTVEEALHQPN